MSLKKIFKKTLGKKYYKFRLTYILNSLFGELYVSSRKKFKKFTSNFNFLKKNLDKKIEHQKIVQKETGFLIDGTKNNYLTYHLRPKNSENFNLESTCKIDEKMAIIIQGPIQEKFFFLKNTLSIYKKIFKNSIIIISTWENEDQDIINTLKDENIFIIFNKEPEKSQYNIDHQIISTNSALKFAHQKGIKYSLKSRADIRIYKNNLETFLISLIKTFPVKNNQLINSRIIVPSLITFRYRLYSISDICLFGETVDLLKYFKKDSFKDGLEIFGLNEKNLLKNSTPVVAEIFLCSRLIQNINGKVHWTLEEWWNSLRNYFCIIDNSSLDLFWYKYDWNYEYRFLRTYSDKFSRAIDFQDWLSLYNNFDNNWHLASNEHEKYDEHLKLTNIFKS
tara:strand:+ start:261 stop:1439 length:1179 start_codon:yes stop_codon:yes gene_type:complete